MPVYEYRCNCCGNRFEALRKLEERDVPIECPGCKSSNTRREVSTFGTTKSSGASKLSSSCSNTGSSKFG
ncbi:MAG: zinc ribbon domain-containing protein [Thermosediminibacteraceae bacterium]|nr:zinc ribbon domain-containing protein [Thermosediminibacteraceae bacterium]